MQIYCKSKLQSTKMSPNNLWSNKIKGPCHKPKQYKIINTWPLDNVRNHETKLQKQRMMGENNLSPHNGCIRLYSVCLISTKYLIHDIFSISYIFPLAKQAHKHITWNSHFKVKAKHNQGSHSAHNKKRNINKNKKNKNKK